MAVEGDARAWHGVGVGRAGAVGPVVQVRSAPRVASDTPVLIDGIPAGRWAVRSVVADAFATVAAGLRQRAARSDSQARPIFESAAELADDRALQSEVLARVADGEPPVAAIDAVIAGFASYLTAAGDYPAAREADLQAVRDRVVAQILGYPQPGVPELIEPSVVVARELSLAEISSLNQDCVLAIVTELGGPTSHAAIFAGQLEVPCIVQAGGVTSLPDGVMVAVDATTGAITLDPTQSERDDLERRRAAMLTLLSDTAAGATRDGHAVALEANISAVADAERLVGNSVEGVGLYRTESMFLDRMVAPTLTEQCDAYMRVLAAMDGKPVTIRTVDGGADKPLKFLGISPETLDGMHHGLGIRGYRLTSLYPEILEVQLRALAEAQELTGRPVRVMAPMVTTAREAREFAKLARNAGIAQVGVMVEVPSAALRAGQILDEVDFISIGTNDLAQYTMAADRTLGELDDLLSPWQPAVLDLIAMATRAGRERAKPVAVCGELASDPVLALVLVGLGAGSLSMAPGAIAPVRHAIRRHTAKQTRAIAHAAMEQAGPAQAFQAALALVDPRVRGDLGL
ncbi:phosphoenolpyruvate-utilizing N-terminal domain-containing protein [Rarobacter faecitabidus]|uniref:Phosphoenolpyruvate-protein phosphotransferase n=1 Tax=Rarobacter faecitabidus TaxID=13243 RepID=A0A542ZXE5_RARFA|nr:putative PEP-binding protein [Rarobacter faecitabidus]TQL65028.1 phosphotransferase system enzyme I (PtsI) [Rarobacter faecitabidus]